MVKRHLKRLAMPRSWKIQRKNVKFVTRPKPGSHSYRLGTSLNLIIRDILKLSKNTRETKRILESNDILVDQTRRKDPGSIVGFMDTMAIPSMNKYYRMILDGKGKLGLIEIKEKECIIKPAKIIGKTFVKGKCQLNLFDGKNVIVDKDSFKVGDSVLLDLGKKNVKETLKLDKGSKIMLIGGKNIGHTGQIEKIEGGKVFYKAKDGVFETLSKYAFVVGDISLK